MGWFRRKPRSLVPSPTSADIHRHFDELRDEALALAPFFGLDFSQVSPSHKIFHVRSSYPVGVAFIVGMTRSVDVIVIPAEGGSEPKIFRFTEEAEMTFTPAGPADFPDESSVPEGRAVVKSFAWPLIHLKFRQHGQQVELIAPALAGYFVGTTE
jgi:hypothetical protein